MSGFEKKSNIKLTDFEEFLSWGLRSSSIYILFPICYLFFEAKKNCLFWTGDFHTHFSLCHLRTSNPNLSPEWTLRFWMLHRYQRWSKTWSWRVTRYSWRALKPSSQPFYYSSYPAWPGQGPLCHLPSQATRHIPPHTCQQIITVCKFGSKTYSFGRIQTPAFFWRLTQLELSVFYGYCEIWFFFQSLLEIWGFFPMSFCEYFLS